VGPTCQREGEKERGEERRGSRGLGGMGRER